MTDIQRAKRPTEDFLKKAGIDELPSNIDIVWWDPATVSDATKHTLPAFLVRSFDEANKLVEEKYVSANEAPERIYENLRREIRGLAA